MLEKDLGSQADTLDVKAWTRRGLQPSEELHGEPEVGVQAPLCSSLAA